MMGFHSDQCTSWADVGGAKKMRPTNRPRLVRSAILLKTLGLLVIIESSRLARNSHVIMG